MYQSLKLECKDSIATITLARGTAMNVFDPSMAQDLLRAFETIANDSEVRAVLLHGEGPVFCAGGDIHHFASKLDEMPSNVPDLIEVLNTVITMMLNLNKPILAAVHGSVAGVGMSLMMACDLVIAAESTKFTMAYAGIGLSPDGGASYLLPRIVGNRRAMQMLLLPEIFTAERAQTLGLVNWLAADDQFTSTTQKILQRLAHGPTFAYKRIKHLVNTTWENSIDDQLLNEMHAFTECTITNDFKRGVQAFLNKKTPVFEGN